MTDRIYINDNWTFTPEWTGALAKAPSSSGHTVRIPHTVRELPLHYFDESLYQMVSAYQRRLFIPKEWKGKRIGLTFEGVAHRATVYVNGTALVTHGCGYTAFTVELGAAVRYGEDNLIAVRCDSRESVNQPPFGYVIDYMTYGGIYRDVYLSVHEPICMEEVFYRPTLQEIPKTRGMSLERLQSVTMQGRLLTEITLSEEAKKRAREQRLVVCQFLNDRQISNQPLGANGTTTTLAGRVHLWDTASPVCYEVRTELRLDGETVDVHRATIGFRHIEWRARGFYLNGRKLTLRGLNRHQSYPYVGYAMPERMQREDARILKNELGCNAVRTSHYPQSQYFIDECDRIGLVVFTEIPGWQHIGDEAWKEQAKKNTRDMVTQYRNHPSIILWGVRINESADDDALYAETNRIARELDPTRPTGGVRAGKQMHLLEDVYTYNDFSHDGTNAGCEPKKTVTPDMAKPYLISEYNGHMYPTKPFDDEEQRREHFLRHAAVLDAATGASGVAGAFGWCMFDYHTHRDFGSGDRVCYHGVMDMFRNPKDAAYVYAAQTDRGSILHVVSGMDIGEHPASVRGETCMIANADAIRMYKNDVLLKEYTQADGKYKNLRHSPVVIDDFIGDAMRQEEQFTGRQNALVKTCLNETAIHGMRITPKVAAAAAQLMLFYRMGIDDAYRLFGKYIGDWGGQASVYRFEAVRAGEVVATVTKAPMSAMHLATRVTTDALVEGHTYDVAAVRVAACDEYENVLPYYGESLRLAAAGSIALIGPDAVAFAGGQTGFYVRTTGERGRGVVRLAAPGMEPVELAFTVTGADEAAPAEA